MPTLLLWGSRDPVIPASHAQLAHEAMPGSRLEVFNGAGHFPFRSDPERFVAVVEDFLRTTSPADWNPLQWRDLLRTGPAREEQAMGSPPHAASPRTPTDGAV
jgi:hypothetical protein